MKRQKIIYCSTEAYNEDNISFIEVQKFLDSGWTVVSVTARNCAVSAGTSSSFAKKVQGGIIVVIEKSE